MTDMKSKKNTGRLISLHEDFPARIFQSQVKAQGSQDQSLVFGKRCSGSFAKYDPDTSSWRMFQLCLTVGRGRIFMKRENTGGTTNQDWKTRYTIR